MRQYSLLVVSLVSSDIQIHRCERGARGKPSGQQWVEGTTADVSCSCTLISRQSTAPTTGCASYLQDISGLTQIWLSSKEI